VPPGSGRRPRERRRHRPWQRGVHEQTPGRFAQWRDLQREPGVASGLGRCPEAEARLRRTFVPPEPGENPRHVDFMWPLWSVLDRAAEGRGSDWLPQLQYP
jgi:hypothetical protein